MAEKKDPRARVWMRRGDTYAPVPGYAVESREAAGWKSISKAEAKKAGYALPGDTETATKSKSEEG